MNLELKHLVPYLPYELRLRHEFIFGYDFVLGGLTKEFIISTDDRKLAINETNYKPILRPLYDYVDINDQKMNDLNCDLIYQIEISAFASKRMSINSLSVGAFEILVSNHVDVFGLINKGLALPLI